MTTQTALLAALKAIVNECMDYPPAPRYSTDSYLPPHLLNAAQAKRFATLQAQFALQGHTLRQFGLGDGFGAVSYLTERWGIAWHLRSLDDADKFLIQINGGQHGAR